MCLPIRNKLAEYLSKSPTRKIINVLQYKKMFL